MNRLHMLIGATVVMSVSLVCAPVDVNAPLSEEPAFVHPPNEVSALLAVRNSKILTWAGWDLAFWAVSDDGRAEDVIFLIGRRVDANPDAPWSTIDPTVLPSAPGALDINSDDAEALFRIGTRVYVTGSHFGKKEGPIQAKRQFFARFDEAAATIENDGVTIRMRVVRDEFRIHRAVNDALAASRLELVGTPALLAEAFIGGAREKYADEEWVDRIRLGDSPINVEGAAALESGCVLLGLRYPVTASGDPVLVELEGVESLFDSEEDNLRVRRIVTLASEDPVKELRGIRALSYMDGAVHAVTGNIDSDPSRSAVLKAHPDGFAARSRHVKIEIGEGPVRTRLMRVLGDFQDVEGAAPGARGSVYVRDTEDAVHLYR